MFYILSGSVAVLNRKDHSYITNLDKEDSFGEIGFFMNTKRTCSILSRDNTEVIILDRDRFI
jgi:CRP-like cAMP-binding protein